MKTISCDGIDLSLFNPTKFKLVFTKLPHTVFWCQSVTLPPVRLNPVSQFSPLLDMKWPGEKLKFEQLQVDIILDKNLESWKELYRWMLELSVLGGATDSFSDCSIITDGATFMFTDVFPIVIQPVNMSLAVTDIVPTTFNVVFEYDKFDIE